MSAVAQEIRCSHCGAPVEFKPGEIIATCKYCGFTTVIETGQAFTFEHSLILNKFDQKSIDEPIHDWMRGGFLNQATSPRNQKLLQKNWFICRFGWFLLKPKALTRAYSNA